jgi:hypothetical protein
VKEKKMGERKGKEKGDACRRFSRRRPRLVGHARSTFARRARKKGKIAPAPIVERRSRVVDTPPSGAGRDDDEGKEGTDIAKGAGQTAGVGHQNGGESGRGSGFRVERALLMKRF